MRKSAKNPFLKPSKNYVFKIITLIICSVTIILVVVLCLLILLGYFKSLDYISKFLFAFLGFLLPLEKNAIQNVKDAFPWEAYLSLLLRKGEIRKNDKIRISYASFLIVEVDQEYLLIKNSHGLDLFQLPGMTYRMSNMKLSELKQKFDVIPCNYIAKSYVDYRLHVPQNKLKKFYKDFCLSINPYDYDYSSLLQDVVNVCKLDEEKFKKAQLDFQKRNVKKIEFSRYTDMYEMMLQDVVIFTPTDEQLEELRKIKNKDSDLYKFASFKEIKANGVNRDKNHMKADIATNAYDCIC